MDQFPHCVVMDVASVDNLADDENVSNNVKTFQALGRNPDSCRPVGWDCLDSWIATSLPWRSQVKDTQDSSILAIFELLIYCLRRIGPFLFATHPSMPTSSMARSNAQPDRLGDLPLDLLLMITDLLGPVSSAVLSISSRRIFMTLGDRCVRHFCYLVLLDSFFIR